MGTKERGTVTHGRIGHVKIVLHKAYEHVDNILMEV